MASALPSSMPDADRARQLHRATLALLPTAAPEYLAVLQDPKRLYVVIDKGNIDLEDTSVESFMWIAGKKKLSLARIESAFQKQTGIAQDIRFSFEGALLDHSSNIADLPEPADRVIVLSAIDPTSVPAAAPESSPAQMHSSQGSARPALQPVNRQVSTPLKQSVDSPLKPELRDPALPPPPPAIPVEQQPLFVKAEEQDDTPQPAPSEFNASGAPGPTAQTSPLTEYTSAQPTPKQEDVEEDKYAPRAQENPFEGSQDQPEPELVNRLKPLTKLAAEEDAALLEAGVEAGLKVLDELERPLQELRGNEDAQTWLQHIDKVRKEAVKSRSVIGVVGNTGSGKSSAINALLDEERLVPTNCMRACTAVVTELSYNHSQNPNSKYRAEIVFIKPEDWQKELNVLFAEILDDSGRISKDISSPDSQAAMSYAKIRAVYPKYTKEMLASSSVNALMNNKKIRSVLGTTRKVHSRDPHSFYRSLQQYVDSKEKGTEKLDKNGNKITNPKREFEHWPLIQVVRVYTKSPALATGAVIVDLPGVHDSNAARAAVAQNYMKQTTGLFIVAPINRAVDDKAAKTLLGDTFKRQLKYDGTYSAVSFICSKTDDISITEAIDSLQLSGKMGDLEDKLDDITLKRRDLKKEKKDAENKLTDFESSAEQIDEDIEEWEALAEKVEDGKTVYAPSKKNKKRKSASASPPARKRRRRALDSDDEDYTEKQPSPEPQSEPEDDRPKSPLTEEDVENKLQELKQLKKEARREKRSLKDRIEDLEHSMDELADEETDIEAKRSEICVAARNEYSRGAIRNDFAQGIRELDMENAEEEDPDNFNPEEDIRDYDEVARTLPVFCVSSRAYQKLSGRMKKDNDVPGFTTAEQTEIPQLQAHCKKLTEKGRQATCRRFLNSCKQLLTSLSIWASDDGTGVRLTTKQRDAEKSFLNRKLKELEKALEDTVGATLDDAVETLHEDLFEKLNPAVDAAVKEAGPKADSWGRPKAEGGLHWGTYRATVRRSGAFAGASGPRDFNAELVEPMYKQLASIWEKVFQRRLPNILNSFKKSATTVLQQFHKAVETRAREKGTGSGRITMLGHNLTTYSNTFGDLVQGATSKLNEGQREINREFTPVILATMDPAYMLAADERGTGSFMRMKGHVAGHVTNEKQRMFQAASQSVRNSLVKLCTEIREDMLGKADDVYLLMNRDYISAYTGSTAGEIKMSREERATRRQVDDGITRADEHFESVLQLDLQALQETLSRAKEDDDQDPSAQMDLEDDSMDVDAIQTESESEDDEEYADEEDEGSPRRSEDAAATRDEDDDI